MNITKLPSGSYRIRQMVGGKTYSVTVDHRPTQIEAMKIISDATAHVKKPQDLTVVKACEAYIEAKKDIVSPSTIRGYKSLIRVISDGFGGMRINAVTGASFQTEVNRYAKGRKPKTVKNYAAFLTAVFSFFDLGLHTPTLPMAVKPKRYFPTAEDVNRILAEVKGTDLEVFFRLAVFGLRRSEICALTVDDLSGNVLTINKALVTDGENHNVVKSTKTTESAGTIKIDDDLADLIRKQGYIWKGHIATPYKNLQRIQYKLGIPRFPLHTFRHFMASYLHYQGVPDKQIQAIGRWKTDHVMKTVYQHEMEMEKAKDKVADILSHI